MVLLQTFPPQHCIWGANYIYYVQIVGLMFTLPPTTNNKYGTTYPKGTI